MDSEFTATRVHGHPLLGSAFPIKRRSRAEGWFEVIVGKSLTQCLQRVLASFDFAGDCFGLASAPSRKQLAVKGHPGRFTLSIRLGANPVRVADSLSD